MLKLRIPEMSCGHCTAAVEKAVKSEDPAAKVDIDLGTKVASITTQVEPQRIRNAIKEAGYESTVADH
jgi:copper chaperone